MRIVALLVFLGFLVVFLAVFAAVVFATGFSSSATGFTASFLGSSFAGAAVVFTAGFTAGFAAVFAVVVFRGCPPHRVRLTGGLERRQPRFVGRGVTCWGEKENRTEMRYGFMERRRQEAVSARRWIMLMSLIGCHLIPSFSRRVGTNRRYSAYVKNRSCPLRAESNSR